MAFKQPRMILHHMFGTFLVSTILDLFGSIENLRGFSERTKKPFFSKCILLSIHNRKQGKCIEKKCHVKDRQMGHYAMVSLWFLFGVNPY